MCASVYSEACSMYFSVTCRHGVMKMLPVDKQGNPLNTTSETRDDESDDSDN